MNPASQKCDLRHNFRGSAAGALHIHRLLGGLSMRSIACSTKAVAAIAKIHLGGFSRAVLYTSLFVGVLGAQTPVAFAATEDAELISLVSPLPPANSHGGA